MKSPNKKKSPQQIDLEVLQCANKIRKQLSLPLLDKTTRNCLKCDSNFISMGPQHRMCERCRNSKDNESDSENILHGIRYL